MSTAAEEQVNETEFLRAEYARIDAELAEIRLRAHLSGIDLSPADDETEASYFKPITAAELDAGDYKMNYLVQGLVCEGQPAILAGQFKTLKTSIALDLAVSVASGTSFLNEFKTEQRSTMVLTAESGLATVQETCRRICKGRGFELGNIPGLLCCDRVPQLQNVNHTEELAAILKGEGVKVLIADPAYLMIEGSEAGNLFSMGDQLRVFAELAAEVDATPVLLHHAKKNNGNAVEYQPLELGDIAWAGFAEFARQWMLLSRRERYEEGSGEHRLWFSVGGSAGHNGCWGLDITEGHPDDTDGRIWTVGVNDAKQARDAATDRRTAAREKAATEKLEKHAQALRDAFIGIGQNGLAKSPAFDRAGLNANNGNKALGLLLRRSVLEECKTNAGSKTVDGYRLTSKEQDQVDSDEDSDTFWSSKKDHPDNPDKDDKP